MNNSGVFCGEIIGLENKLVIVEIGGVERKLGVAEGMESALLEQMFEKVKLIVQNKVVILCTADVEGNHNTKYFVEEHLNEEIWGVFFHLLLYSFTLFICVYLLNINYSELGENEVAEKEEFREMDETLDETVLNDESVPSPSGAVSLLFCLYIK